MNLIKPNILKLILNHDNKIKRALAILNDNWSSIYNENPLAVNKLNINDIKLANELNQSGMIKSKVNFNNYQSIHQFVVKNDNYMELSAKKFLLNIFE